MKNKRIIIDARHLKSGIGSYIKGIIKNIPQEMISEFSFVGRPLELNKIRKNLSIIPNYDQIYTLREQYSIMRQCRDARILHVPHFNLPVFYNGQMINTIHDVIFFALPELIKNNHLKKIYNQVMFSRIANKSNAVIAVSNFTRNEILKYTDIQAKVIQVIYNGIADEYFENIPNNETAQDIEHVGVKCPYILFVGNDKPNKNINYLIELFSHLKRTHRIPHILVLAGAIDSACIMRLRVDTSNLKIISRCSDKQIHSLYAKASAYIIPSKYEGFSITPLEALASGCPVIASDIPVHHEILNDHVTYISLKSIQNDSALIMEILESDTCHKDQSIQFARRFTWNIATQKTIEIYKALF